MRTIFRTWSALAIAIVAWSSLSAQEDVYDWRKGRELHPGIRFVRVEAKQPRKMVVYGARIDAWMPDMRLRTTSRRAEWVEGKTETDRQTTRDFLRRSRSAGVNMVLAVNADAFSPWPAPYNQSTPTDLQGLAVSDGAVVSRGAGSPSLLELKTGALRIAATTPDTDLTNVRNAVSGFALCLDNGQPIDGGNDLHPRTGLGLSEDQRYLVLVAIDGRQPSSGGATTQELGTWLKHFGAHRGINMDGGGSTSLAWWDVESGDPDKCRLLNRPVGNGANAEKLPELLFFPSERANGNNLGVVVDTPRTTHDADLYLFVDDHWLGPPLRWTIKTDLARPVTDEAADAEFRINGNAVPNTPAALTRSQSRRTIWSYGEIIVGHLGFHFHRTSARLGHSCRNNMPSRYRPLLRSEYSHDPHKGRVVRAAATPIPANANKSLTQPESRCTKTHVEKFGRA